MPSAIITQEISNLVQNLELEQRKYHKYKIIKDVAQEYVTNKNTSKTEIQSKIFDILMIHDLQQCVTVTTSDGSFDLLNFKAPHITTEENEHINETIQQAVIRKCTGIINELTGYGIKFETNNEDRILFDLKNVLNEKQTLYTQNLQKLLTLLDEILGIKKNIIPKLAEEKAQESEIKMKIFDLKSEILKFRVNFNIFMETNKSMQAYEEIMKDISQLQEQYKKEIDSLQMLKEKYVQISCKQYDEILKNYLQFHNNIQIKKQFYQKLVNK